MHYIMFLYHYILFVAIAELAGNKVFPWIFSRDGFRNALNNLVFLMPRQRVALAWKSGDTHTMRLDVGSLT